MRHTAHAAWLVALVATVLTSCATGSAQTPAEGPADASPSPTPSLSLLGAEDTLARSCTAIGNAEGISVDFTTAVPLEGGDYYATVSVPSLGASQTTGFAGNDEYSLAGGVGADLSDDPVRVDVRVVGGDGQVAFAASTLATPQLFQPNGAACDGENYRISLRATRDGELVDWDWETQGEPRDEQGRVSLPVYTECGVLVISDAYNAYLRVGGRLDDGTGGPPAGWNTSYQRGWAAIDGDTLTFQDDRGHTEVFQRVASEDVPVSCG